MSELGKLTIQYHVIDPTPHGVDPDNLIDRKLRFVTVLSRHAVTRDEAAKMVKEFVMDNFKEEQFADLVCTWTMTERFYM